MILHFDFKVVSFFLTDLFVPNIGRINLSPSMNTLIWIYSKVTHFFVEIVKIMLYRNYETDP